MNSKIMTNKIGIFAVTGLLAVYCNKPQAPAEGVISFLKGSAHIERGEKTDLQRIPAKTGDRLQVGDTVVTGEKSAVILEILPAKLELQANSRFKLEQGGDGKKLYLERGNIWTHVSKLGTRQTFDLRTPTTVAGVRGTKFYTFFEGGNTGTCHCEGRIEYKNTMSGQAQVNDGDYLVYHRKEKSVKVTVAELTKMGIPFGHNHSALDDSAIGAKSQLTDAHHKALAAYIDKKFAALK